MIKTTKRLSEDAIQFTFAFPIPINTMPVLNNVFVGFLHRAADDGAWLEVITDEKTWRRFLDLMHNMSLAVNDELAQSRIELAMVEFETWLVTEKVGL